MTESRKYRVPEEALKVCVAADPSGWESAIERVLQAFIRWQSEHPQLPTPEQGEKLYAIAEATTDGFGQTHPAYAKAAAVATEWGPQDV
jgi:hypothetical protein